MSDTTRIDFESLKAAKGKYQTLVKDAERGLPNLHAAYKLGESDG